mmetsp:Transcript_32365/g.80533  ORF Transcript_32365/g.80533 Transcript_32365/m.80533 type:complete len:369 (-) Transcript_32365:422-1528(-)
MPSAGERGHPCCGDEHAAAAAGARGPGDERDVCAGRRALRTRSAVRPGLLRLRGSPGLCACPRLLCHTVTPADCRRRSCRSRDPRRPGRLRRQVGPGTPRRRAPRERRRCRAGRRAECAGQRAAAQGGADARLLLPRGGRAGERGREQARAGRGVPCGNHGFRRDGAGGRLGQRGGRVGRDLRLRTRSADLAAEGGHRHGAAQAKRVGGLLHGKKVRRDQDDQNGPRLCLGEGVAGKGRDRNPQRKPGLELGRGRRGCGGVGRRGRARCAAAARRAQAGRRDARGQVAAAGGGGGRGRRPGRERRAQATAAAGDRQRARQARRPARPRALAELLRQPGARRGGARHVNARQDGVAAGHGTGAGRGGHH